jgi:hypothetical protein
MSAQQEIERQLQISGKLESAIEEVAKRLGRSRSWLMEAWTLDINTIIRKIYRFET